MVSLIYIGCGDLDLFHWGVTLCHLTYTSLCRTPLCHCPWLQAFYSMHMTFKNHSILSKLYLSLCVLMNMCVVEPNATVLMIPQRCKIPPGTRIFCPLSKSETASQSVVVSGCHVWCRPNTLQIGPKASVPPVPVSCSLLCVSLSRGKPTASLTAAFTKVNTTMRKC